MEQAHNYNTKSKSKQSWLWRNRTSKNQLWRHFSDVIVIISPKNVTKITSQSFSILGPPPLLPQSKFLATPVLKTDRYHFFKNRYRYFQKFFTDSWPTADIRLSTDTRFAYRYFCRYFDKVFWLKLVWIAYSPALR